MGNRKKNYWCRTDLHKWLDGPGSRCNDCGDWDLMFAPREVYLLLFKHFERNGPAH